MLSYIAQKSGIVWEPQTLTICWSRRLIQYKRPLALFADIERLKKILTSSPVPVRVIIAGVPHPQDAWANDALHQILLLCSNQLNGLMTYLPEYNPDVSRILVAGADVWLNTPVVGLEACGTSGMKASLNGSLTLSTGDGWMAEVDMRTIGWELGDSSVSSDIYQLLEDQIIPLWSQYIAGTSTVWVDMMKRSRLLIQSQFSATRMVEEYRKIWGK
jgi:starch phosphorylase